MAYSFRFYGRSPGDWHEGANDGHLYELQFQTALSPEQREALARRFESAFSGGPARAASTPWLWSDRFACFAVGERWTSAPRATFARVAEFIVATSQHTPLIDVVFWGLREGGKSAWDRWSFAQQAPDPGPPYPQGSFGPRGADPALPVAAPDPAFEEARKQAKASLDRARIAKVIAGSEFSLEPVDPVPPPLEAAPNPFEGLEGDYRPHPSASRPVASRIVDKRTHAIAYVDDSGAVQEVAFPDGALPHPRYAVHPDGDRGLGAVLTHLHSIDFVTGDATPRWKAEGVYGLGFIGDLWVVRAPKQLVVLDPSTERPTLVAKARHTGTILHVLRSGTLLWTSDYGEKPALFGFCEGKLKRLASWKLKLTAPREVDGRILVTAASGTFELTGIDELWEAWAVPLRAKAEKARLKKRRAPSASKPTLSLEPIDALPEPPQLVGATPAQRELFDEGATIVAAGGAVAALVPGGDHHRRFDVAYLEEGEVKTLGAEAFATIGMKPFFHKLYVAGHGRSAALLTNESIAVLDLPQGTLSRYEHATFGPIQVLMPTPDSLLVRFENRIEWAQRIDGAWTLTDSVDVPKLGLMLADETTLVALSHGTKRMIVFALASTGICKVEAFEESVIEAWLIEGGLSVKTRHGDTFEVAGLAEVVAAKLAAQAKKPRVQRLLWRRIDASTLPPPGLPESVAAWAEDKSIDTRTVLLAADGSKAWGSSWEREAILELNLAKNSSRKLIDLVNKQQVKRAAVVDKRLIGITSSKLVVLEKSGRSWEPTHSIGSPKCLGLAVFETMPVAVTIGDRMLRFYAVRPGEKPKKFAEVPSDGYTLLADGDRLLTFTRPHNAWEVVNVREVYEQLR